MLGRILFYLKLTNFLNFNYKNVTQSQHQQGIQDGLKSIRSAYFTLLFPVA
jgi:hypothetical protein